MDSSSEDECEVAVAVGGGGAGAKGASAGGASAKPKAVGGKAAEDDDRVVMVVDARGAFGLVVFFEWAAAAREICQPAPLPPA
jgi:hypothetical protein